MVPRWLHVDAPLNQSSDSGSGKTMWGPCSFYSSCVPRCVTDDAGGPPLGVPAASLTICKKISSCALACLFDGLSDHWPTACRVTHCSRMCSNKGHASCTLE